ncbi:hypothetical protein P4639_22735 [Priestia megaterium]|uniref:hypothetical protein n=1 Tax=Priestia megaterium TaxID=1404 RepID=UPI002E1EF00C|nr:hypothetical protein [Priestia megaterium]
MITAKEVSIVNTGTTLTATEVQGAIGQIMFRLNYDRDRIETLEGQSTAHNQLIFSLNDLVNENKDMINLLRSQVDELRMQNGMLQARIDMLEVK